MSKTKQFNKVDFEGLLNWFSPNEEEAGEKYEQIHKGLQRYFRYRGCSDPDDLADETINRVAMKLPDLDLSVKAKKISIFYGFALNIYRENLAKWEKREVQLNPDLITQKDSDQEGSKEIICLENCLSKFSEEDRDLILRYYSKEKGKKIILRKKMAEEMNITTNALHVRIYRLKGILKICIDECLEKNV